MELFGFSAAKIITILIIAILIFGPDKVPEMARTVGKTIRDVRRYINGMTQEFNDATGGLRDEFTAITQDLKGELEATQADLRSQLDITGIFAGAAATMDEASTPPLTAALDASPLVPTTVAPVDGVVGVSSSPRLSDTSVGGPISEHVPPVYGNGTSGVRHVTKAGPFADLQVLATPTSGGHAIQSANSHGGMAERRNVGELQPAARRVIGQSVAGSAYLRRNIAPLSTPAGLCRSARIGSSTRDRRTYAPVIVTPVSTAIQWSRK